MGNYWPKRKDVSDERRPQQNEMAHIDTSLPPPNIPLPLQKIMDDEEKHRLKTKLSEIDDEEKHRAVLGIKVVSDDDIYEYRELQPPRRTVLGIKVGSDDDIYEHFGGFPVGSFHDEYLGLKERRERSLRDKSVATDMEKSDKSTGPSNMSSEYKSTFTQLKLCTSFDDYSSRLSKLKYTRRHTVYHIESDDDHFESDDDELGPFDDEFIEKRQEIDYKKRRLAESDDDELKSDDDELGPFDDECKYTRRAGENEIKEWIRQNFSFLVSEIEWTRLKNCSVFKKIDYVTKLAEIEKSVHYRKQRVERLLLESMSFNTPSLLDLFDAIIRTTHVSYKTFISDTKQHHVSELEMDEQHACTKCSENTPLDLLSMCDNIPEEVYFELLCNGHLEAEEVLRIHKCGNNHKQIEKFVSIIRNRSHRPLLLRYFVEAVFSVARQRTFLNLTKIIESLKDKLCEDLKTSFAIGKPKKEREFEKRKQMEDNVLLTDTPKEDKIKASNSPQEEEGTDSKESTDNMFAIVTFHAVKDVDSKLLEKILQRKEIINKSIKEYGQITDAWLGTVNIVIQLKGKSAQNVPKCCIDKIVQQMLKDEGIQEIIRTYDVEIDFKIDIAKDVIEDDENDFQKRKLALRTYFSYIKEQLFVGSFIVEFQRNEIMDKDSFVDEFQFGIGGSLQKSAQKFIEYIIKSDSEKVMEAFFKVLNEESYYKDIFKTLTDYVQKLKISEMFEYGLKAECVNTEVKSMVSYSDLSDQTADNTINNQTCSNTVSLNKDKNDASAQAQTETDIVHLNPPHFQLFQNTTVVPISVKIFQNVNIINKKQATVIGSKGINIQLGSDDLSTENENFVAVGKGRKMVCYKRECDKEEDEEDDSEDSADNDGLNGNENSNGDDTSHVNRDDAGADLCSGVCTVHSGEGIVDSGNISCFNRDPVHTVRGCDAGNRDHVCSSENRISEHRDDSNIESCNDDDTRNETRYSSCPAGGVSRGSNVSSKHDSSGCSRDERSGDGYYSGNGNDCSGFSGYISTRGNVSSRDDIVRGACGDHINKGGDGNGGEDCDMSRSDGGVGNISEGQCHEGNIERNRVDTSDTKHCIRHIDDNPSIMV